MLSFKNVALERKRSLGEENLCGKNERGACLVKLRVGHVTVELCNVTRKDGAEFELIEKYRMCVLADSHKSVAKRVQIVDVERVLSRATGIAE